MKENSEKKNDPVVHKFTVVDEYDPELIQIPSEFENLATDDVVETFGRKKVKRSTIRGRSDRNLENYDAWRAPDRVMKKGDGKHPAIAKLKIAPALLVRTFGQPNQTQIFCEGTGEYNFEDNNLDTFCLFDYKKTDFYHGLNREDEFYLTESNRRKPMHKRKRKWPSIEEFWASEEPVEFKLCADDQADWRKFKRWLRKKLEAGSKLTKSFDEMVLSKYGHELDICLGNFEEKGVVNTDIACFKYDWTMMMTK